MALDRFDKNMNIVSMLDNEPNDVGGLSAEELKAKFDEGGEALKTYLNEVLLPQLEKLGIESITRGVNGVSYIRLNADNVLEVSADGKEYEATGSSGHLIIDADGNAMPQRGRLQFPDGSVEDIAGVTVVKSIGGIPVAQKGAPNGVAELDETGKVPAGQMASLEDYGAAPAGYGLGDSNKMLDDDVDIDTLRLIGWTSFSSKNTSPNKPFSFGDILNSNYGSETTGQQIASSRAVTVPKIKVRNMHGGVWNEWYELLHEGNGATFESGTWTPVFKDGAVFTADKATYVKIGNIVFVSAEIKMNGADTEEIRFSGLPFSPTTTHVGHFWSVFVSNPAPSVVSDHIYVPASGECYLFKAGSEYTGRFVSPAEVGINNSAIIQLVYKTSS